MPPKKRSSGNLVIVESPAKAKTIERYLGPGYTVTASYGHVRDLPQKKLGVDLEHDFAPHYEPLKERRKELEKLADQALALLIVLRRREPDAPRPFRPVFRPPRASPHPSRVSSVSLS